ncbi:MAG: hypothetical protein D4R67_11520 [Bacteroidetes bacterium]|nr:MAG: hypothetical protein D4R67_11520 [Bacteroidota bacterium]
MKIKTIHGVNSRFRKTNPRIMKSTRLVLSGLSFMLSGVLFAQIDPSYQAAILHLKTVSSSGRPLPAATIQLTDRVTNRSLYVQSDPSGQIEIPVLPGHDYLVTDGEGEVLKEISIPQRQTAPLVKTIHLDELSVGSGHPFDTVAQQPGTTSLKGNMLEGIVTISLRDGDGAPLKTVPVKLVCPKYRKVILSTTDAMGMVRFQVYLGGDYQLGVEESEQVKTFRVPLLTGYTMRVMITYQPTAITEHQSNDTIYQEYIPRKGATTARAFLEALVTDYRQGPLANENVYLDVVGKSQVYTATTDEQGKAYFLLPYNQNYTLHLTYERDIFLCKYPYRKGYLVEDEVFITYRGTRQIEDFFHKSNRDEQGFITEFMPVEVKKIGFDPSNVQPTEHGYHVNFPSRSETPTPAVFNDDDVIQGGGYYSKQLYSFNNKTGRFNWGLELGDNGVSASVCTEDFLIITTESCTLYAIDGNTGELAWSKWLGPEIHSTPTVADGKVYAVYPTELRIPLKGSMPYAVICFELKSGTILWQNWVDSEPIGSPVASDQSVFITTSRGNLYQFDNTTGLVQGTLTQGICTSPPTIAGDRIYLTCKDPESPGREQLNAYHVNSLVPCGSFPLHATYADGTSSYLTPSEQMNYSGGRPLFYRDRLYAVSGTLLICLDPVRLSTEWSFDLSAIPGMEDEAFTTMPIAANQQIIAATRSGKALVIDPVKGTLKTSYDLEAPVTFQPVVHAGWIYAASSEGKLISYNTGNPALTGWPMCSMNAANNPVVE